MRFWGISKNVSVYSILGPVSWVLLNWQNLESIAFDELLLYFYCKKTKMFRNQKKPKCFKQTTFRASAKLIFYWFSRPPNRNLVLLLLTGSRFRWRTVLPRVFRIGKRPIVTLHWPNAWPFKFFRIHMDFAEVYWLLKELGACSIETFHWG